MPKDTVHTGLHQRVALLALHLHRVVEVAASVRHCKRPDRLANDHQRQTQRRLHFHTPEHRRRPPEVAIGQKEAEEDTLRDRGAVCDVVLPAILGQQERGDIGLQRVISGCDVVLEEVEEAERGYEEGHAPQRGRDDGQEADGDDQTRSKGDAQQESPN